MEKFNISNLLQSIFKEDIFSVDIRKAFDEKLEAYGITKSKTLSLLGIDKDVFEDILNGTASQPNLIHVIKLADFLEVGLQDVVNAVIKGQSADTIASLDRSRKVSFLLKHFDLKRLTSLGFLEKGVNPDDVLYRLLAFFGYTNVSEFEDNLNLPLFSRTKRLFTDKMMKFWISAAYQVFKSVNNPYAYNREELVEIVVKAKPYCEDIDNGLLSVCTALYHCGVTVIAQAHLPTTQTRGGTFIVNGKPCIVLTDLGKSYPTVWTTLMHELHHVLYDLPIIERTSFHLSDDSQPDLFLIEEKANKFAMDYFCELNHFQYIRHNINNKYIVDKFAKDLNVHPSMLYNAFQFYQQKLYNKNFWGAFKPQIPKSTVALGKLNLITWQEGSVNEIAEKLKKTFDINI